MTLRTDLALESIYTHQDEGIIKQERQTGVCKVTNIQITTSYASRLVGKPMGNFVTLELENLPQNETVEIEGIAKVLAEEIKKLLPRNYEKILVVGLGNRNITPDALGPDVMERVMVTGHVLSYLNQGDSHDFSAVSAICPGVLGITGIETVDIVKGVVEQYRPSVVIAVDALCAGSPHRMFRTVQLTDTGIHPGSGVGNRRDGLNKESLGVPVISIGIPTVVDSDAIVYTALTRFFEANDSLAEAERMIGDMMQYTQGEMFVSPKEIDSLIAKSARVIAGGINLALHQNIDLTFSENFVS
ncbi:MAG: GPR endopeptidase [Clostridia bacterium]|nr:GPR endopeptidase [Clostridia bacterium]